MDAKELTVTEMREWLTNSDAQYHPALRDDWDSVPDAEVVAHYKLCTEAEE